MTPIKTAAALDRAWSRWPGSFPKFMARLDQDRVAYLSHSKFSEFERCRCCYYRQYVLGEQQDFPAMRLGTLFHKAAGALYRSKSTSTASRLLNGLSLKTLDTDRRAKLHNAIVLLCQHRWSDCEVVSVEQPFFIDLATGLPPVIGVADLILREEKRLIVVDHKTSIKFNDLGSDQLVLYAEHVRRCHKARRVVGFFDEYRLVPNLSSIRKPAFRRTPVAVDRALLPSLAKRYRAAWNEIATLAQDGEPMPDDDCWICRRRSYSVWEQKKLQFEEVMRAKHRRQQKLFAERPRWLRALR